MGAFKFSLKKDAPHQRPWERGRLCAVPALAPHPVAIGSRGAEGTRKKLRAAALAFPTAAAPLISPKLCGPPTGLPMSDDRVLVWVWVWSDGERNDERGQSFFFQLFWAVENKAAIFFAA